ncbi:MAG: hypothetical protein RSB67_01570 [Clostridia bacterium]
MYEQIAWNNFLKTGNIDLYIEYKKFLDIENIKNKNEIQNIGENYCEFNQNKGDSN